MSKRAVDRIAQIAAQSAPWDANMTAYRIKPPDTPQADLSRLASHFALDPKATRTDSTESVLDDGVRSVRYDPTHACYRYLDRDAAQLAVGTPLHTDLDASARRELDSVLGRSSSDFIVDGSSNYVVLCPDSSRPSVLARSYVYRKLLDGRVVMDGRVGIQVVFCRTARIASFELADPVLEPAPISVVVRSPNVLQRLGAFAQAVSTYGEGDQSSQVDTIRAIDVGRTYVRETRDDGDYLVPCVSVILQYQLDGGQSAQVQEHFSLDAASRKYRTVDPLLAQ
jgi:hypothetical protein